ncbi:MAG: hypothetical protein ABSA17_03060 [Rhabdochlamydiaceae bacterium]|jgi:hypothetical protein
MEKEQMLKRISELETLNDQLVAELNYLDRLLKEVGFENGLITLKMAAQELLEEEQPRDEKAE